MSYLLVYRYLCSILHGIRASTIQGTSPTIDSYLDPFLLRKIAPSSTAPEANNLPLNIPSKGIVDQAFLINYDGCEENSKSADCWPYFFCLIVWFTGLSVSFTAFATSSSVSFTTFTTTAQYSPLHSSWPLQWSSSLLSTITIGRRTWRGSYAPKDSLDS